MEYRREFQLQVAHFNNALAYDLYEKALKQKESNQPEVLQSAIYNLLSCLKYLHGHNLRVEVVLTGSYITTKDSLDSWQGIGYIVDDADLEDLVMKWDNTNLSVLPEFAGVGKRATTEELAYSLAKKIFCRWTHLKSVEVSIWETPQIRAKCVLADEKEAGA